MPNGDKETVVILGGGCGGVTAAFELTATQELRDRFEVELYTLGWRLGGKGASGRNRDHAFRIEEHGLHVWFGFYDNSFDVLRQAYEQMNKPANPLFNTVDDAFHESNNILLWHECPKGRWKPVRAKMPALPSLPGGIPWQMLLVTLGVIDEHGTPLILEHPDVAEEAGFFEPHPLAEQASAALTGLAEMREEVSKLESFNRLGEGPVQTWQLLHLTQALAETRATFEGLAAPELEHERLAASLLGALVGPWEKFIDGLKDAAEDVVCTAKLAYMGVDFVHAMWDMIVRDVLVAGTFDDLDDHELTTRLKHRGMSNYTADNAPWLRGFYDLVFGFEGGDWTKPNLAAGAAVKSMLQIVFNSKGTVMSKMNAGMGDVVFSPLYEVLRQRGVKVHFFQRVRRLELSADGTRVDKIWLQPQAQLKPGIADYDPFVPELTDWPCWPSAPNWEQLEGGDDLKHTLSQAQTTLEDERWDSGAPEEPLEWGNDKNFEHVVLAVSVASIKGLCAELYDQGGDFQAMIDNSFTVATQACQLWFKKALLTPGLGWKHDEDPISAAYVEPLDTHSDMTHLVTCERWPAGTVGSIAYFCGPLPDTRSPTPHAAKNAARDYARDHVKLLEPFFPNAFAGGAFDSAELTAPGVQAGSDPFLTQYWRANSVGSERYVQTPYGSVEHRLEPHRSGYSNLFLAGDWTRTGIDGGCVEAAVLSGRAAAKAIAGLPVPAIHDTDPFPPVPPP